MADENNTFNPPTEGGFTKATPAERFLAALIDSVICWVFTLINVYLGWIVMIGYMLVKDALPFLDGQSIGKKLMKIRVVEEGTLKPITNAYDKSVIRGVSLFIPIFGLIDALMVLIDKDQKRFGDKWANTIVIKNQ